MIGRNCLPSCNMLERFYIFSSKPKNTIMLDNDSHETNYLLNLVDKPIIGLLISVNDKLDIYYLFRTRVTSDIVSSKSSYCKQSFNSIFAHLSSSRQLAPDFVPIFPPVTMAVELSSSSYLHGPCGLSAIPNSNDMFLNLQARRNFGVRS